MAITKLGAPNGHECGLHREEREGKVPLTRRYCTPLRLGEEGWHLHGRKERGPALTAACQAVCCMPLLLCSHTQQKNMASNLSQAWSVTPTAFNRRPSTMLFMKMKPEAHPPWCFLGDGQWGSHGRGLFPPWAPAPSVDGEAPGRMFSTEDAVSLLTRVEKLYLILLNNNLITLNHAKQHLPLKNCIPFKVLKTN